MAHVKSVSLLAVVFSLFYAVGCGGQVADVGTDSDSGTPNGEGGVGAPGSPGNPNPGGPVLDASTMPGPMTGPATITCGMTSCDPSTQECCVMIMGGGGMPMGGGTCTAKGACMGGVSLACSSASSCMAGNVCCFTLTNMGGGATCQPSCMGMGGGGPGPGGGATQLCATNAECPMGQTCEMGIGGLKSCRRTRGPRDAG